MRRISIRAWVSLVIAFAPFGCAKPGALVPAPATRAVAQVAAVESATVVRAPSPWPSSDGERDPPVLTSLPPLPRIANVRAVITGDSAEIAFEPVDGARDYRVYELPDDQNVVKDANGAVTIRNAIYRCAGDRQAPAPLLDGAPLRQGTAIRTLVDGQNIEGHTRTLAEATLGNVYIAPGPDRIPVYALGDPTEQGEDECEERWTASRVKKYVTSSEERAELRRRRWRDDGPVFFVPAGGGPGKRAVLTSEEGDPKVRYYFVDGPEMKRRQTPEKAFFVLSDPGPDTRPLMRVFYENQCGKSHDELVAGRARFERARRQGDQSPMFSLHWSGLTGPTTLVVEALDRGCPYQGSLAPVSRAKFVSSDGIKYPPWLTLSDMKAASATKEVYVNGQHEPTNRPRATARSFVRVSPAPVPALDWFAGFGPHDPIGPFTDRPCGEPEGNCWQEFRQKSPFADVMFMYVETPRWGIASVLGELWVAYADVGADVNGKFRMTPPAKGRMSADSFLYVTMQVDSFSTLRRYPQILISDQEPPVQWKLKKGKTLVVETFLDWPNSYELQVCDHRNWDTNEQCPAFNFHRLAKSGDPDGDVELAPNAEVGEHVGMDQSTRFEVYTSTKRAYLFLDGEPYGCAILPNAGVPSGAVTVTFGDVLYHSGVDNVFQFGKKHLQIETRRHFDNLGFKSAVAEPPWDETRLPCVSRMFDR